MTLTTLLPSTTPAASSPAGESPHRLPPDGPQNATKASTLSAAYPALHCLTGVQILSVGAYAPPEVVTNADLASLGCDAEWIVQRTGIRERRRAAADVATSDLAYEAAVRCLQRAGVSIDQVDLIVLATMTPDSPTPSTACQMQRRLGGRAPAFDVSAACAGFMFALVTGMQFVKTGCARRVLVVGADLMTRVVDPADKKIFPLFGDGAGAVLLGPGDEDQGLLSYSLGADGSGASLLQTYAGGTREPLTAEGIAAGRQYMQMEGRAVFKWAVHLLVDSIRECLGAAGLTPAELDCLVLHQANHRILTAAADALEIPPEKLAINLDRYGNTSAASIPLVLDELQTAGRLRRGDHILISGFGAGLAWGTGVFRW
ncbi:MAG: beta-ketoacyl-ACP synthase III [Pirellulaceae bacterium]